jgi:hypothetical protein
MSGNTAEYVVSTAFAEILEGYGIDADPHPQLRDGEPDVFVRDRGTRVVIELKKSGNRQALLDQMETRLEQGMGEVVFGVLFPSSIVEGGITTPSVSQVKDDLHGATLEVWAETNATSSVEASDGFSSEIGDFTDLIPRFTGELLAGEQLDETVELVEDTAHGFVSDILNLDSSEGIARNIEETLEGLGDTSRDEDDAMSEEEIQEYLVSGGLILFNATAFYGLLSQNRDELRPLRQRLSDEDGVWKRAMRNAFDEALEINYDSVFITAEQVLETLPTSPVVQDSLEEIQDVAETVLARSGLLRQDLTGRVYHSTLGRTLAKNYATYYTQIPSGELLAWLGISDWDAKVGEFACGSGTLVTASYHRKLSLAFEMVTEEGEAGEDDVTKPRAAWEDNSGMSDIHKKFVEEDLWGLDAMSFAAHLTAVNLALQQPEVPFDESHIYQVPVTRDGQSRLGSLDLLNSSTVRVQSRLEEEEASGAGRQSMAMTEVQELRVPKGDYDLVIMNPPFTRADRAADILDTSKLNTILKEEFPERDYANTTRSGLAAPFTILGDEAVKPGGRLALVVPSGLLSRETWQPVRQFLNENYHLEHIVISWAEGEPAFSENTELREVLIVARKLKPNDDNGQFTMMTHIDKPFDFMQSRLMGTDLTEEINPNRITIQRPQEDPLMDGVSKLGAVKSAPKSITEQTSDNWYRLVAFRDQDLLRLMLATEGFLSKAHTPYNIRLPDAFRQLNDISESVNLFMKNKKSAGYAYSDDEVSGGDPVIVSARFNQLGAEDDSDKWVYRDPSLTVSESFNYGTGHLLVMRKMNMWATMRVGAIASADNSRFTGSSWIPIEMPADLTTTDGEDISRSEAAQVVATWINSTFGIVPYIGYRAETEGAYGEWKTNQVRRITALDPSELTREQVDTLLEVFEDYHEQEWGLFRTQVRDAQNENDHPRRKLDIAVANAVFDAEEPEEDDVDPVPPSETIELDDLYEDLYNTLELLGDVMT